MVSTLSDEIPPFADNPEAKQVPTPGPASSGTVNNVGGLDKPTTSGAGTSEENRKDLDHDAERTMDTINLDCSVSDEGRGGLKSGSGSETSDEPEPTITAVGMEKPKPPTPIPDQGSDNKIKIDQNEKLNSDFFSINNMNIYISQDSQSSFKQKTAETEHVDNEDSEADMHNTQDDDSYVSNMAEITTGDLQLNINISMSPPNKC